MAAPPQLYATFPKVNQCNQAANLKSQYDVSVGRGLPAREKPQLGRAVRDKWLLSDVEHVCPALSRLGLALGHFPVVEITEFLCQLT